jgi:hypothetical protein
VIEQRQGSSVVMRGLVLEEPKKGAGVGSESYVEMEEIRGEEESQEEEAEEVSPEKTRQNISRRGS